MTAPDLTAIAADLFPHWPATLHLQWREQCDSTSTRLREEDLPAGTVLIGGCQTAGRGQQGRPWRSLPGGLYLSARLDPDCPLEQASALQTGLIVGLVERLRADLGLPVGIKWPNDLVLERLKLGGLLVETELRQQRLATTVIGVGVNVRNPVEFPGINLGDRPDLDLTRVTTTVLRGLADGWRLGLGSEAGLSDRYDQLLVNRGQHIPWQDGGEATVLGLAPDGQLRLQTPEGLRTVAPGQLRLGYPTPG